MSKSKRRDTFVMLWEGKEVTVDIRKFSNKDWELVVRNGVLYALTNQVVKLEDITR